MNKSILWLMGLLFSFSFLSVSCSESEGELDPYAHWEERNQHYLDSIADVARANRGNEVGQWKVIKFFKLEGLGQGNLGGNPGSGNVGGMVQPDKVEDFIYCKILHKGEGKVTPLYTDSVGTHYRGRLINGEQFDSSYSGDQFEEEFAEPTKFGVNQVINGWTTALQKMVVGDRWEVYIPSKLAYGATGTTGIPGHSTLVFDMKLVEIYPLKGHESRLINP